MCLRLPLSLTVVVDFAPPRRLAADLEQVASSEGKVLIFVNTKRQADDLTQVLRDNKWPALCTHGDKEQPERDWVMSEFRKGTHPILVATAVAERGLGEFDPPSLPTSALTFRSADDRYLGHHSRHQL